MRTIMTFGFVLAVAAWPATAQAAGCADDVRAFAAQRGVASDPPRGTPGDRSGSITSDQLARSGGVVAPAEQPRTRVITPPPNGDAMRTTPDVPPHTQQGRSTDDTEEAAARRTQIQGLIDAALAAAARGDESACVGALSRAQSVASAD